MYVYMLYMQTSYNFNYHEGTIAVGSMLFET